MAKRPRAVRRAPIQARAASRREALLDAASSLLDTQGFEGVTTRAIARSAGAAVGTVYDYFPNKQAVYLALLERYRERLSAALDTALGEAQGWESAVHEGIEVFYRFYRDEPGYQALWLGSQLIDVLRDRGRRWASEFSKRIELAAAVFFPSAPPQQVEVVARLVVHIVSAAATAALTGPKRLARPVVDEAKALAVLYIETRLGGS